MGVCWLTIMIITPAALPTLRAAAVRENNSPEGLPVQGVGREDGVE